MDGSSPIPVRVIPQNYATTDHPRPPTLIEMQSGGLGFGGAFGAPKKKDDGLTAIDVD